MIDFQTWNNSAVPEQSFQVGAWHTGHTRDIYRMPCGTLLIEDNYMPANPFKTPTTEVVIDWLLDPTPELFTLIESADGLYRDDPYAEGKVSVCFIGENAMQESYDFVVKNKSSIL